MWVFIWRLARKDVNFAMTDKVIKISCEVGGGGGGGVVYLAKTGHIY